MVRRLQVFLIALGTAVLTTTPSSACPRCPAGIAARERVVGQAERAGRSREETP